MATKNQEKTETTVSGSDAPKRRGRPKGATDKTTRKKRKDQNIQVKPEITNKTNKFGMALYNLPKIDIDNLDQVDQRISDFFMICDQFDMKPTVASLAISFGISRITLFTWLTGKYHGVKNQECLNSIKRAYDYIGSLYETYLNNGAMNPVSCFFLMKNNYGYKDVTDYVITGNQEQQLSLTDITDRSGLLGE